MKLRLQVRKEEIKRQPGVAVLPATPGGVADRVTDVVLRPAAAWSSLVFCPTATGRGGQHVVKR